MKKLLIAALLTPLMALAQTYPSPTFNSLTLQNPLTVANGGTGASTSTGSGSIVLSSSPALTNPTVTGTFTATGLVTTSDLAVQAANTVLANVTGSTANPTAYAMPGCSTSSSALGYTNGTGIICNTSINAATLGGATFASPSPLGSTTPNSGAFTSVSANAGLTVSAGGESVTGGLIVSGGATIAGASSFSTSVTAPTQAIGNNSTNVATTQFVATRGCPNIMDHGGDNTNTNDNAAAWTATLAAAPNTSAAACIYFPPGKYKFLSAISYTLPSSGIGNVVVKGEGLDSSILYFPNGSGMQINFPTARVSAHVRDLSITTGTTNTGVGLAYLETGSIADPSSTPGSTIINVAVHGDDGYAGGAYADYWQYGVVINGVTYVAAYNLNTAGTPSHVGVGLLAEGSASTSYPAAIAINSSNFESQNTGIIYGSYVQGMTVFQSSFAGDNIGIQSQAGETGILDGLLVTGSEFATHQYGILTNTAIGNTQIVGNAFQNLTASGVNIDLNPSNVFIVVGNIIECGTTSSTFGFIAATSSTGGGMISGNEFSLCGTGVNLGSGTSAINVQSNYYLSNTTNIANAGTGNTIGGGSP